MTNITLAAPKNVWQWLQLYHLYRTAFPAAEQKPFALILHCLRQGKMDVWCINRDGKFSGLATTMKHKDLVLIDYLAVAANCRGAGVGTAALAELRKCYTGKSLFLEIESVYEDAPNIVQRQRRKAFYLRCGLTPMHMMVRLGGVNMEVLGFDCKVDYESYFALYKHNVGEWANTRVVPLVHPEA